MNPVLANKQIVVGVTGGIAAYKSADFVRRLREAGAVVRVVMTDHAKAFITPLTMQAVSGHPVYDDLFDLQAEAAMGHIELARWADAMVIAPATADVMAKIAHGEANDLLTTLCLATRAKLILVPAMNQVMWENSLTQANVQALQTKHMYIWGPGTGSQACGEVGPGRMLEPITLVEQLSALFMTGSLSGKQVLITAGPTHEAIDPVRYITNVSSGKMGYALAESAIEAGAHVTLISGPVHLVPPVRAEYIPVISARQMYNAVLQRVKDCDIFLSVAAVSDYHCQSVASQKIAKSAEQLTLVLERNPDILATVAELPTRPYLVGFAAETDHLISKAQAKWTKKKLDMIIANEVGEQKGMGQEDNTVTVLWKNQQKAFATMSKVKLARELIALIAGEIHNGRSH